MAPHGLNVALAVTPLAIGRHRYRVDAIGSVVILPTEFNVWKQGYVNLTLKGDHEII